MLSLFLSRCHYLLLIASLVIIRLIPYLNFLFFFLRTRRPPSSPLFPSTPLFRSPPVLRLRDGLRNADGREPPRAAAALAESHARAAPPLTRLFPPRCGASAAEVGTALGAEAASGGQRHGNAPWHLSRTGQTGLVRRHVLTSPRG